MPLKVKQSAPLKKIEVTFMAHYGTQIRKTQLHHMLKTLVLNTAIIRSHNLTFSFCMYQTHDIRHHDKTIYDDKR